MTNEETIQMLEALKTEMTQAIDERIANLSPDRNAAAAGAPDWELPDQRPHGTWTEIGRSSGDTYRWPDGVVEPYEEVVRYRGSADFAGLKLALGFNEDGGVAGLVLTPDDEFLRAPTYFFPTDDAGTTNEKISMIRGAGARGRSGFGPSDPVPPAYAAMRTDMLRNRISTKWNRLGVITHVEDHETMLVHTAIQAKARHIA